MKGFNETAGLVVRGRQQLPPLFDTERRGRKHGRRHLQTIRSEIFQEAERERKGSHGASCRGPKIQIDFIGIGPDRFKRSRNDRAFTRESRARGQVHQLPPPNRRIMAVVGRLVEYGQQTIVKTHRYPESFKRTVRELYGMVYIALRSLCLTIPKRDTAEDRRKATKKGA